MNTDGSYSEQTCTGGIGGIICDSQGWVIGFQKSVQCLNHNFSETEALLNGLKVAYTHKMLPLEIEIDSFEILHLFEKSSSLFIHLL